MVAGDLSGDDDGVIFDQAFHRHAAVLVMGEAVSDDSICDLVADLIHMTTGYLFRCVNSTHGSNPPKSVGRQRCVPPPRIWVYWYRLVEEVLIVLGSEVILCTGLAAERSTVRIRVVYWTVFIALIIAGIVKILFTHFKFIKGQRVVTSFSIGISILAVLFLAMTREAYAITVVFLLLLVKSALLYKQIKVGIR